MKKYLFTIITFTLALTILPNTGYSAAPKKKEEEKPIIIPDEILIPPLQMQLKTKSKKPKSMTMNFKINLNEGGFEKVCPFLPDIVDAINIKMNNEPQTVNILKGRERGNFYLEITKFIKNKFPELRQHIHTIVTIDQFPSLPPEEVVHYNQCNKMPLNLVE